MVRASIVAPAALAAGAFAVNTAPPVPLDAQIGLLHFPVTCQIYYFLNQTFDTVFTATAPVYGGQGQEIYYTDVTGNIDIPESIVNLAPLIGATQAQANVSINLDLTNASPSTLLAYQATLNGIQLPSGQDAHIKIPLAGGTLPPIGPVTLGTPGVPHRILLGEVQVDINLQNASGHTQFGPIPVVCGKQNVDYIIGSVNVNETTGLEPFAPSVGYAPSFPETPEDFESGSFRFPYDCEFGPLGLQHLDLIIGGTVPIYLAPGQEFSLTNGQSFLSIPQSLIDLAKEGFPTVSTFDTTIYSFEILFDNATPAAFNVTQNGALHSSIDVDSATSIPIPATGSLTIGPVSAGAAGTVAALQVGTANATTELKDASGKVLFSFPISCQVPSSLELIGIPITNQVPGNYSLF